MDRAEEIMASKRLARADEEWQTFVSRLPHREREIVLLLVAHLDARPEDEETNNA